MDLILSCRGVNKKNDVVLLYECREMTDGFSNVWKYIITFERRKFHLYISQPLEDIQLCSRSSFIQH